MEELDLRELLNIFWSKRVEILLIIGVFLVIGLAYSFLFVEPKYESTTTVILANSSNVSESITTTDLTLNQSLVSTYSELIKSKNILIEVIKSLNLNKTYSELRNNITVSAVSDTDLIEITVIDEDPEVACKIASKTAEIFIEKVAHDVYKIDNVQVWDEAEVPSSPCNINHVKDIIIFIVIGFVLSAIYVLVSNMLDITIKSREDVEKRMGLTVLTTIPICDFRMNANHKQGGKKQ